MNTLFYMIIKGGFHRVTLTLVCLFYGLFIVLGVNATPLQVTAHIDNTIDAKLLVEGLPKSWSINVSPRNDIFLTDRSGGIVVLDEQWQHRRYTTSISDLIADSHGGFLDIKFHPDYLTNGWVYLSYSAGSSDLNRLKVIRFILPDEGNEITKMEDVFTILSDKNTPVHYGGRLAFLPDDTLLITTGDGWDFREQAQLKSSHLGKILRVTDTGKAPEDNPFFLSAVKADTKESNGSSASSFNQNYVYSLGHRNPQALLVTKAGVVISNEHGPAGGDEINIIEKGQNYGWPIITNGKDYSGALISPFTEYKGMRQPDYDWTPSIAPSGMVLYSGTSLPSLTDYLLVTSLKLKQLRALSLSHDQIKDERILLNNFKYRLRDITVDNQGNILLLTDGDNAKIFKLVSK